MQPVIPSITEKYCPSCKTIKPLEDFTRCNNRRFGRAGYCRVCKSYWAKTKYKYMPNKALVQKRYREKRKTYEGREQIREHVRRHSRKVLYGIMPEDYLQILQAQDGKCAICQTPPRARTMHDLTLHIDHNHQTGKVRGLLCFQCNNGLGQFRDSPALLQIAIGYLFQYDR